MIIAIFIINTIIITTSLIILVSSLHQAGVELQKLKSWGSPVSFFFGSLKREY